MEASKKPARTALVAYGSETGNANDYAEELGRLLQRIHFNTHVAKLDAVEISSLNDYAAVIVVISTTGQGDLPTNSRIFWKSLLRSKLPQDHLRDVQFTTFGLGDRSYPKFNWAARKLHKRFLQLGALETWPRGEADEQHEEGLDASFVPWSANLRNRLLSHFPLGDGVSPLPEQTLLEPKWLLCDAIRYSDRLSNEADNDAISYQSSDVRNGIGRETGTFHTTPDYSATNTDQRLLVEVQENRRVTPVSHWQDVRHLAFTSRSYTPYGPGDVLVIYPQNPFECVNEIISMMSWTDVADKVIAFAPTMSKHPDMVYPPPPIIVPGNPKLTLRYLLTHYLDLIAIPRRFFFSMIAHFTTDQFQKDRLFEFTDPKYVDELYDYTTRPRRSILEVLQEFETVKIPWQWAASLFPVLRGRQFSIASGGYLKANMDGSTRFELLVAIVKYKTVIKKVREGVCTRYLAGLKPGNCISVSLQKGGLGINKVDLHTPVIMVGPGTGIASIRSLIWERMLWKEAFKGTAQSENGKSATQNTLVDSNLLFFGCRYEGADYFYKDEWDKLCAEGALLVYPAFSRDQVQKHYVQDAIREQSREVYDMLHFRGAIVYVCGSSGKMPIAVRGALLDVIQERGGTYGSTPMSKEAASIYMEGLEKEGRYKQETW